MAAREIVGVGRQTGSATPERVRSFRSSSSRRSSWFTGAPVLLLAAVLFPFPPRPTPCLRRCRSCSITVTRTKLRDECSGRHEASRYRRPSRRVSVISSTGREILKIRGERREPGETDPRKSERERGISRIFYALILEARGIVGMFGKIKSIFNALISASAVFAGRHRSRLSHFLQKPSGRPLDNSFVLRVVVRLASARAKARREKFSSSHGKDPDDFQGVARKSAAGDAPLGSMVNKRRAANSPGRRSLLLFTTAWPAA